MKMSPMKLTFKSAEGGGLFSPQLGWMPSVLWLGFKERRRLSKAEPSPCWGAGQRSPALGGGPAPGVPASRVALTGSVH